MRCQWDLWFTRWHWDRFLSVCLALSASLIVSPIFHIQSPIFRGMKSGRIWEFIPHKHHVASPYQKGHFYRDLDITSSCVGGFVIYREIHLLRIRDFTLKMSKSLLMTGIMHLSLSFQYGCGIFSNIRILE